MGCSNCDDSTNDCRPCEDCPPPVDPMRPRCDVVLIDGVYENSTIHIENGCIVEVFSGEPMQYKPDPCCSSVTGGSSGGGTRGEQGPPGQNATISIGTVITTAAGTAASVENRGTPTNAILDFKIPRGDKGEAQQGGDYNFNRSGIVIENGLVMDLPMDWPPYSTIFTQGDVNNGIALTIIDDPRMNGHATISVDATEFVESENEKWTRVINTMRTTLENDYNAKINAANAKIDDLINRVKALEAKVK